MKHKPLLIIIITSFLLAGCWDRLELQNITVVTGMAVDVGENAKYKLSVEGINATELGAKTAQGNAPTVVYSLDGNTIAELTDKMNIAFANHAIYSHMKVLVIGEELAKKGDLAFLDFLERNREIREDFNFVVAKGVNAEDVLRVTYPLNKAASLKIHQQLEMAYESWGAYPQVKLNELINALSSPGRQPVLTVLTVKGDPTKGITVENMKKTTPDAIVVIDSLAVFNDSKLIGYLSLIDTRNYIWMQNKLKKTSVTISCKKDKYFPLTLTNSKTNVTGEIKNGRPKIKVKVEAVGVIEGNQCNEPLDQIKIYEKFERLTNEQLKNSMMNTIGKVQKEYKVDIFGFGEVVRRQDYKDYKKREGNWDEAFADAEIDVKFDVRIRRSGIRINSYETK